MIEYINKRLSRRRFPFQTGEEKSYVMKCGSVYIVQFN